MDAARTPTIRASPDSAKRPTRGTPRPSRAPLPCSKADRAPVPPGLPRRASTYRATCRWWAEGKYREALRDHYAGAAPARGPGKDLSLTGARMPAAAARWTNPWPFGTSNVWPRTGSIPGISRSLAHPPARPERVAIVGSGPAGLSAAYHLARKGILSTIYRGPAPGRRNAAGGDSGAHRLPRGPSWTARSRSITGLGCGNQDQYAP